MISSARYYIPTFNDYVYKLSEFHYAQENEVFEDMKTH